MTMTPEPFDAPKKRSGFRVFLYVLAALLALLLLTCGAGVYFLTQTEQGQKIAEVVGQATEIAQAGMNAPGAEELRQLGCDTAIVMELGDLAGMMEVFEETGELPEEQARTKMVLCQINLLGGDPPSCEAVVRTYIEAAAPDRPFMVGVTKGRSDPICDGTFDVDGTELE